MESHVAPKDTAVKTESPTQVTTTKPLSTPPSQPIKSSQAVYKTFADRKWFDLSYIERLKERTKTLEDFVKQKRSGQLQKKIGRSRRSTAQPADETTLKEDKYAPYFAKIHAAIKKIEDINQIITDRGPFTSGKEGQPKVKNKQFVFQEFNFIPELEDDYIISLEQTITDNLNHIQALSRHTFTEGNGREILDSFLPLPQELHEKFNNVQKATHRKEALLHAYRETHPINPTEKEQKTSFLAVSDPKDQPKNLSQNEAKHEYWFDESYVKLLRSKTEELKSLVSKKKVEEGKEDKYKKFIDGIEASVTAIEELNKDIKLNGPYKDAKEQLVIKNDQYQGELNFIPRLDPSNIYALQSGIVASIAGMQAASKKLFNQGKGKRIAETLKGLANELTPRSGKKSSHTTEAFLFKDYIAHHNPELQEEAKYEPSVSSTASTLTLTPSTTSSPESSTPPHSPLSTGSGSDGELHDDTDLKSSTPSHSSPRHSALGSTFVLTEIDLQRHLNKAKQEAEEQLRKSLEEKQQAELQKAKQAFEEEKQLLLKEQTALLREEQIRVVRDQEAKRLEDKKSAAEREQQLLGRIKTLEDDDKSKTQEKEQALRSSSEFKERLDRAESRNAELQARIDHFGEVKYNHPEEGHGQAARLEAENRELDKRLKTEEAKTRGYESRISSLTTQLGQEQAKKAPANVWNYVGIGLFCVGIFLCLTGIGSLAGAPMAIAGATLEFTLIGASICTAAGGAGVLYGAYRGIRSAWEWYKGDSEAISQDPPATSPTNPPTSSTSTATLERQTGSAPTATHSNQSPRELKTTVISSNDKKQHKTLVHSSSSNNLAALRKLGLPEPQPLSTNTGTAEHSTLRERKKDEEKSEEKPNGRLKRTYSAADLSHLKQFTTFVPEPTTETTSQGARTGFNYHKKMN